MTTQKVSATKNKLIIVAQRQRQATSTPLTTSVSLSAQGKGDDIGSDTNTAAGAAAAGVDRQVVGASALATTAGVALGVVVASHVRPLAERGLAEEHGASIAQLLDDEGITRHNVAQQRQAAGARLQVVRGGDVVLDDEGNAVQGATDLALLALGIALRSNGEQVGVDLDDGTVRTRLAMSNVHE